MCPVLCSRRRSQHARTPLILSCLFLVYSSLSPASRAVDRPVRLRAFPQDPRRLRSLDQLHVLRGYGGELRRPKLSRFHHDRRSGGLASHWFLHLAEHGGLLQRGSCPSLLFSCSQTATWSDASWTAMAWWKPLTHTTWMLVSTT